MGVLKIKEIGFDGHVIRVTPGGDFSLADVTRALGYSTNRSSMELLHHGELYQGHVSKFDFGTRGPAGNAITPEGLGIYLSRADGKQHAASKLNKYLKAYTATALDPEQARRLDAEEVLRDSLKFLSKLPGIPTELADEFVELKKKITALI